MSVSLLLFFIEFIFLSLMIIGGLQPLPIEATKGQGPPPIVAKQHITAWFGLCMEWLHFLQPRSRFGTGFFGTNY